MQRIVHSLIHRWLDPAIAVAYIADLRHLLSHEITDPEMCKVSLSIQLVNLAQGFLERRGPVWSVQIPHVDRLSLQRFQGPHKVLP
jgi:hypothetical protein